MPKELQGEDKVWFNENQVYNATGTKNKKPKPKPVHVAYVEYDFLQNVYVLFKWVRTNHPTLKGRRFFYLLYLYPRGLFTRQDFINKYKPYGMQPAKVFDELIRDGWVKEWRGKTDEYNALYDLTHSAKKLLGKLHKVCTGEDSISDDVRYNRLALKDPPQRIDSYYMYAIKRMNRERDMTPEEFEKGKRLGVK